MFQAQIYLKFQWVSFEKEFVPVKLCFSISVLFEWLEVKMIKHRAPRCWLCRKWWEFSESFWSLHLRFWINFPLMLERPLWIESLPLTQQHKARPLCNAPSEITWSRPSWQESERCTHTANFAQVLLIKTVDVTVKVCMLPNYTWNFCFGGSSLSHWTLFSRQSLNNQSIIVHFCSFRFCRDTLDSGAQAEIFTDALGGLKYSSLNVIKNTSWNKYLCC